MSVGKMIGIGVGIFAALIVIGFIFQAVGLGFYGYFAPKYEDAKREVFENTQSYVHGKIQDLQKKYGEWMKAESEVDKSVIEEMIRMEFANFPSDKIDNETLRNFLESVMNHQKYSPPSSY